MSVDTEPQLKSFLKILIGVQYERLFKARITDKTPDLLIRSQ